MKLDLMTGAAVLFAAGAVVYAQKNSKKSVGAGIWDMLKSQRDQVGAAVPQSTAYAKWLTQNPGSYDGKEYWA